MIGFFGDLMKFGFMPCVVKRATIMAIVVGTILIAINHGNCLCVGDCDYFRVFQCLLTYLVPYSVSTVSSVMAIAANQNPVAESECSLTEKLND